MNIYIYIEGKGRQTNLIELIDVGVEGGREDLGVGVLLLDGVEGIQQVTQKTRT